MVTVSKHAEKRLKERCGLNKRSVKRMADKAFTDGIRHSDTRGRLNKWVTSLYFYNQTANNIRLYGDKAYIFAGSTLVTVIQIPPDLRKYMRGMEGDFDGD